MTWRSTLVVAVWLVASPLALQPLARQDQAHDRGPAEPALEAQLVTADADLSARRHAEALAGYTAVAAAAEARQLPALQARALEGLARVHWAQGAFPPARTHAAAALALRETQDDPQAASRAARLLSEVTEAAGDRPAAFAAAARARIAADAGGDPAEQVRAAMRWAWLAPSNADRISALEGAVPLARRAGVPELTAGTLHRLGDYYFTAANYEAALPALEEAERLYHDLDLPADRGRVFNSLGRVYRAHGRLDEALRFQQQALALHEHAGDPLALVQSLNAVSAVYQRRLDYPNARAYLDRALALVPGAGAPAAEDFLRANLAAVLNVAGEYVQAAAMLEAVIARGRDNFMSLRHGQLSFAYAHLGRTADALAAAERGVASCGEDVDACANAYMFRAGALQGMGDLAAARRDVDEALARLDEVRQRLVPTDYFKQNFFESYQRGIGAAIAVNMQDGQVRRALEIAEGARSRALLDLMASRANDASAPNRPRTERQQRLAVPSSLAAVVAAAQRLHSTVLSYWVTDDAVFIWVVGPQGDVRGERVEVLRSTLTALVAETAPLAEPALATPSSPRLATVATRGARQLLAGPAPPITAWRALHRLLIEPVRASLPTAPGSLLTIIPHGPLQKVSFAALQDATGRYLLEDYALHYASAGALLQFTGARQRSEARAGSMLIVSDPSPAPLSKLDRPLPRLAGARSEARAITRLVPARQLTALSDAAAGEGAVREQMAHKAVLHFATHAVVRDDEPFASYLALAPSVPAGDGFLRAEDIYDLDLQADLVVLSACRSADGSVAGDGVATFARAFVFAGAASIVASVWDVADQPTNRLLPAFYRSWLSGASKARSLRRAQLALLADLRAGRVRVATPIGTVPLAEHPAFWAGFALFGEPD